MIFILASAIVYTLLMTVGLFLPSFFLPLYVVLFHVGNMLAFGVWYATFKICVEEKESGADKVFDRQRLILRIVAVIQTLFFVGMFIAGFAGFGFCKGHTHWPYAWLGFNVIFALMWLTLHVFRYRENFRV